jgi:ABC-type nickel/cobalt efflux system permease component RcnA
MAGSILFGVLIDFIFDSLAVKINRSMSESHGILEQISAVILLGLVGWHLFRGWFKKKDKSCDGGSYCS